MLRSSTIAVIDPCQRRSDEAGPGPAAPRPAYIAAATSQIYADLPASPKEHPVFRLSIRKKIMAIAVTLVTLMVVTAVWTVVLVMQVGSRIEEFAYSYVPAYGDLARANIRSLERGLTIRRIIIDKLQSPDDSS